MFSGTIAGSMRLQLGDDLIVRLYGHRLVVVLQPVQQRPRDHRLVVVLQLVQQRLRLYRGLLRLTSSPWSPPSVSGSPPSDIVSVVSSVIIAYRVGFASMIIAYCVGFASMIIAYCVGFASMIMPPAECRGLPRGCATSASASGRQYRPASYSQAESKCVITN